jgi:hypothetical protein
MEMVLPTQVENSPYTYRWNKVASIHGAKGLYHRVTMNDTESCERKAMASTYLKSQRPRVKEEAENGRLE